MIFCIETILMVFFCKIEVYSPEKFIPTHFGPVLVQIWAFFGHNIGINEGATGKKFTKIILNIFQTKLSLHVFFKETRFLSSRVSNWPNSLAILKNIDFFSKPTTKKESTWPN